MHDFKRDCYIRISLMTDVCVCIMFCLLIFRRMEIIGNRVNSLPTGPYKRKSLMIYDFAGSYRQLGACYVDENTTIRFSEKLYPNS